jgi:CheY-like chemotaxis protein
MGLVFCAGWAGKVATMRVLIVDPCSDSAELLSIMLGLLGHECVICDDPLGVAESFQPEAVLMDLTSGAYEAARTLRRKHGDAIKLLAVTGWVGSRYREAAKDAGFDVHFAKPVRVAEIQEVLI